MQPIVNLARTHPLRVLQVVFPSPFRSLGRVRHGGQRPWRTRSGLSTPNSPRHQPSDNPQIADCRLELQSAICNVHILLGIWNGLLLVGRLTLPLRMHWTQTRWRLTVPLMSIWMFWRLGRKVRRLMPVTLRPTPPRYLALPRRAYLFPKTGFFPQIAHCIPIGPITPAGGRAKGQAHDYWKCSV